MNKVTINGFVIFLISIFAVQANAQIYKCESQSGKVFYNDKPCPVYDKETKLKAVKDPKNGYIPPAFVKDPEKDQSSGVVIGQEESRSLKPTLNKESDSQEINKPANTNDPSKKIARSTPSLDSASGRVPYSQTNNKEAKAFARQKRLPLKRVELKVEHREY